MRKYFAILLTVLLCSGALFVNAEQFSQADKTEAAEVTDEGNEMIWPFTDVGGSGDSEAEDYQYYYDAVHWALENRITNGISEFCFGPEKSCKRQEMIIFLWRMSGRPRMDNNQKLYEDAAEQFLDLSAYSPETDTNHAVSWAYHEGIVQGFPDRTFHPEEAITRIDAIMLLYRYAGSPDVSGKESEEPFTDLRQLSSSGTDGLRSVIWSCQSGISCGYPDGSFHPLDLCLRGHVITFLYRFAVDVKDIQSGICGDHLEWTLEKNTLTIHGTGEMYDYDNDTVPWCGLRDSIRSVLIEEGVTSVGSHAFYNCQKLNKFAVPSTVKRIGSYAYSRSNLFNVLIPSTVIEIGDWAFSHVIEMGQIKISPGTEAVTIGQGAFAYCGSSRLIAIIIPINVTKIGKSACKYSGQRIYYGGDSLRWNQIGGKDTVAGDQKIAYTFNSALART